MLTTRQLKFSMSYLWLVLFTFYLAHRSLRNHDGHFWIWIIAGLFGLGMIIWRQVEGI